VAPRFLFAAGSAKLVVLRPVRSTPRSRPKQEGEGPVQGRVDQGEGEGGEDYCRPSPSATRSGCTPFPAWPRSSRGDLVGAGYDATLTLVPEGHDTMPLSGAGHEQLTQLTLEVARR
jgi:hypothetical protein